MVQKIKIDGSWKHIVAVYKKVNGHWVTQENYSFDNQAYFYDSGTVDADVFLIVANDAYTGNQFYVIAKLNNTQVNPTWSITSGNQYATINQSGQISILTGAENSLITVKADFDSFSDSKQITVTYDNFMSIEGLSSMTGTSGNVIALYHSQVVNPVWSITSGNQYATIDQSGEITILASGQITVQATYANTVETKNITLTYDEGSSSHIDINPDTGAITNTETTTTTDLETGAVTETSTTTITNPDGSSSETQSETVTNTDGSSTTNSTTTNSDGTSSETTSSTSAPDPNTGSVTSQTETINYDSNGDLTGSQTNQTVSNTDGSSTSSTTNYDVSGNPIDRTNIGTDSTGNVNTQNIEYDEQGNQTVTGYTIDTEASEGEGKKIEGNGINTEFVPFKFASDGFVLNIVFKTIASEQPNPPITPDTEDSGSNYLYTILGAKTTAKVGSIWPGFEIRWTIAKSNNGSAELQISRTLSGETSSTRTNFVSGHDGNNVYDITITYDPSQTTNKFIVHNNITNTNIQTSNKTIQSDLDLDLTIGYSTDHLGNPIRHSNVTVYDFSVQRLANS